MALVISSSSGETVSILGREEPSKLAPYARAISVAVANNVFQAGAMLMDSSTARTTLDTLKFKLRMDIYSSIDPFEDSSDLEGTCTIAYDDKKCKFSVIYDGDDLLLRSRYVEEDIVMPANEVRHVPCAGFEMYRLDGETNSAGNLLCAVDLSRYLYTKSDDDGTAGTGARKIQDKTDFSLRLPSVKMLEELNVMEALKQSL